MSKFTCPARSVSHELPESNVRLGLRAAPGSAQPPAYGEIPVQGPTMRVTWLATARQRSLDLIQTSVKRYSPLTS